MIHSGQSVKQAMVSVESATEIILATCRDYGTERIDFTQAVGRALANDVYSDIDFPPYNRITMDGIAIMFSAFEKGIRKFKIKATQAAGDSFVQIISDDECVEVMTGASLSASVDTVIRIEDLAIENGFATIKTENIRKGQNIHRKGEDKKKGDIIAHSGTMISPAVIAVLSSSGNINPLVKKLPAIMVISTGNEIVEPNQFPGPFEIRNSNKYVIASALEQLAVKPATMHIKDDEKTITEKLEFALNNFDVVVLCGGVSKGKFDFIPPALEHLGVKKLFHHVQQRPGKPFWFGIYGDKPVFAFPGNAMSVFLCLYRYLIPWLKKSLGLKGQNMTSILEADVKFAPALQYFLPVKLEFRGGRLISMPVHTNGSGDFINLLQADAFMEFPSDRENFKNGEIFPVWPFKNLLNV